MRNKLKRAKNSQNTKTQPRTADVITLVLSESSNDETAPETDSVLLAAEDAFSSKGATDMFLKAQTLREKKTCCHTDVKIAPIFLRTIRQSKSKGSSDGGLHQPVEKLHESILPAQREQHLSTPTVSPLTERKGTWRGQVSPSALQSCLKEIQTSNSAFPVQGVFGCLQTKARERLQDSGSTADNQWQSRNHQNQSINKRKQENESSQKASKRPRNRLTTEGAVGTSALSPQDVKCTVPPVRTQPRFSRLSRTHRPKQETLVNHNVTNSERPNQTESDSHSFETCDILQREPSSEDVLWTDKYSPQRSSEVIGNSVSVNKLHSWLEKWKQRADRDERRKAQERKLEENSSDSWDCGDFQGEAGSEDDRGKPLCNTMLITGPSGVGKTASVYACAQELGFKVFEVNCSSQRSGHHVLSQLKEATQSHLVETTGKDPLKPAYFNNYTTKSCLAKNENVPGKSVAPKNVISSSKNRSAQKCGRFNRKGKANPATVTLASYFKMKAKADHLHFGGLSSSASSSSSEKPDTKPSPRSDPAVSQNKKMATSLILFEEVDVIFEDDVGFLAAIKTFMTTTKRPVILTTNDPTFRERFSGSLEEIIFKTPPAVNACSYLQLVCLAENVKVELEDVIDLVTLTRGDIRRCLLQLQFWVNSNGGWPKEPSRLQIEHKLDSHEAGCTTSMLGLHPVTPNYLLNLLKSWTEPDRNQLLTHLTESWRRAVPLLLCNLELLLPIRTNGTSSELQSKPAPCEVQLETKAINSNSVRNKHKLSRKKYIESSNLSTKPQQTSLSLKAAPLRTSSSVGKPDKAAKVASDCLNALTDFFDLMSYVDATVPPAEPLVSGPCNEFVWTGAAIKDSLLDEMREEEGGSSGQERLLEIQAAVEGLGCHSVWNRVSEAWTEAQRCRQGLGDARWRRLMETLTVSVSSNRKSPSFSCQPLCAPSVSQSRYKLSRSVLSSQSFSLLGNRRAVSVDYMPILRCISRSQRSQEDRPVRCLNNLSSIDLGLSKSTMQLLAEDFSKSSLEKGC